MKASILKKNARNELKGKWLKAGLITFIFLLIEIMLLLLVIYTKIPGLIVSTLINLSIFHGLNITMYKLRKGEKIKFYTIFVEGFKGNTVFKLIGIVLNMLLKSILPLCIMLIGVIVIAVSINKIKNESKDFEVTEELKQRYTQEQIETIVSIKDGDIGYVLLGGFFLIVGTFYLSIRFLYFVFSGFILYENPNYKCKTIVEKSKELMKFRRWKFFYLNLTFLGANLLSIISLGIGYLWLTPYIIFAFVLFYENAIEEKDSVVRIRKHVRKKKNKNKK